MLNGAAAQPDFFDIFQFHFVEGDATRALRQRDGIVLTKNAARRLFGGATALGQKLTVRGVGSDLPVVVTGVVEAPPQPTKLAFDCLWVMQRDPDGVWQMFDGSTYAKLPKDGASLSALDARMQAVLARRIPPDVQSRTTIRVHAVPVTRQSELDMNNEVFGLQGGPFSVLAGLMGLGVLVLAIACLNYANLSIAQGLSRSGETAMRRVLGASLAGLLAQAWVEAAIAALAALMTCLLILAVARPVIVAQGGIDILRAVALDPKAIAITLAVTMAVSLLAGALPALAAARARPAQRLHPGRSAAGRGMAAQVLVGLQFASASALLIAVLVIGQQNAHIRQVALTQTRDPVVNLPQQDLSGVSTDTLRQRLAPYPQIRAVGDSSGIPWAEGEAFMTASRTPAGLADPNQDVRSLSVGFGYFEAFDQTVLAGRVFDRARDWPKIIAGKPYEPGPGPSVAGAPLTPYEGRTVIDEAYARRLGFASPAAAVGQKLYVGDDDRWVIIGVVKTRVQNIRSLNANGTLYSLWLSPQSPVMVRIAASDLDGGLAALRKVWGELSTQPLEVNFVDDAFRANLATFTRIAVLFSTLAALAFAIAAIGLFGMAVHATQRRMHEIGVRKTLGSSAGQVVGLLLADFSRPVILANLLAWPAAYLAMQAYLAGFSVRIDLGAGPFVLSFLITLAIAALAVGGQTLRAASIRPARVLRDA